MPGVIPTQETVQIAFHEASHAVISHCLRLPVSSVSISEGTGCCATPSEWRMAFSDRQIREFVEREALMRLIVVGCAGKAALDKWYGYKAKSYENWRASDDYKSAFQHVLKICNGDQQGAGLLLAWLERRSEVLVERHWDRINTLGSKLLERSKLSGTEINEILRDNGNEQPESKVENLSR
jgi:hypothetical protein